MIRKIVSLLICILLALATPLTACYAANETGMIARPNYQHIDRVFISLTIHNKTMQVTGRGVSQDNNTCTLLSVVLQKATGNSSAWINDKSWSTTAEGWDDATINKSATAEPGCRYRAIATCTIVTKEGAILEKAQVYSNVVAPK
ncbi:MAG: hypothetical protein IJ214_07985 [Clostridia bacterium]|nr:hypothetical protein [Clostridia bacterium]